MNNKTIREILEIFCSLYPNPKCGLNYDTPFQLLVATVMAAQATDKKVNQITEALFKKYPTPEAFAKLTESEIAEEIKSINFYKTKARNIASLCKALVEEYNGQVPPARDNLMKLAGVGRKTANVVLSDALNIPAIAVDTHVLRVSNRLGLVCSDDVLKTELELESMIPRELWINAHNYLVLHGRYVCNAKKPKCEMCKLSDYCKYYRANSEKILENKE